MIKKRITYTDYNGEKRVQDFYFNFSEAELIELNMELPGGLKGYIEKIIQTKDTAKLAEIFKELLLKSYGEKTEDGLFKKSDAIREKLVFSAAYSELYMGLINDTDSAIEFVKGLLPANLVSQLPGDFDTKLDGQLAEMGIEQSKPNN